MCGICGFFNKTDKGRDKLDLERMCQEIRHRGPDAGGVFLSENGLCGLGHRRLSIVDLSDSANQPMSNANNEIWISYNGEIYNAEDIKQQIEKKYIWKTDHSDTEVIVHAYEEWGISFIEKLRGVFAIALWDKRYNKLFGVFQK